MWGYLKRMDPQVTMDFRTKNDLSLLQWIGLLGKIYRNTT